MPPRCGQAAAHRLAGGGVRGHKHGAALRARMGWAVWRTLAACLGARLRASHAAHPAVIHERPKEHRTFSTWITASC